MKEEIKTLSDLLAWVGDDAFKLKMICESVVTFESVIPLMHEGSLYDFKVDVFYDGGCCLEYDTLTDILREHPKVFMVECESPDFNREVLFKAKYTDYDKKENSPNLDLQKFFIEEKENRGE